MKMRLLSLFALCCLLAAAAPGMVSRQAIEAVQDAITNAPAETVSTGSTATAETAPPAEGSTAAATLIAAGTFARPAIAAGPAGMLAVAAEGPKMASVWLWVWNGKAWSGGQIVTASPQTAGRTYVADVLVDAEGWTWVSWRYGNKEVGTWHGPGVAIRSPAGQITLTYPGITTGAARLGADPAIPGAAIVLSKDGAWGAVDRSGAVVRRGTFPAGSTGEKFDFAVSGSRWATCHNGYSAQASAVAVGAIAGGTRQTWADYKTYPGQGNDLCYPSVAFDAAGDVWCSTVYSGRNRLQEIAGGRLRWPATALADLGPAVTGDRCPPRLAVKSGRLLAVWEAPGQAIMRADVEAVLAGKAKTARIAGGSQPAVAVDSGGRMHLVYVAGGVRYQVIQ